MNRNIQARSSEWSEGLKATTFKMINSRGIEFISFDNKLHIKHISSGYAFIKMEDLYNGLLRVVDKTTGAEVVYPNADDLIKDGWAVD